jgi:uncharacterized protein YkwD
VKLPRLCAAAVLILIAARAGTMRPDNRVLRIAAPDLTVPLVEIYPESAQPRDPVKAAVFERINRDRTAHGLAAVLWDEAASRVSDAFCAQQVRERSRGHYLMDGVPPYARTGLAGVFGFGSENSASWSTTDRAFDKSFTWLALSGHDNMMDERPPSDGHRKTILDPEATHVGVGYFSRGGRFQMSQEFLTRRLDRVALSIVGSRLPILAVEGRVSAPARIQFVTIAREPKPAPLTQAQASAHTSYSYPDPVESYVPEGSRNLQVIGTSTFDRLRLRKNREFSFTYQPSVAGLYTFVFYVARDGQKPTQGGSATVLFE